MSTTKGLDNYEMTDFMARMEREHAEQEHHGREAIAAACLQLASLGITKVHIAYDGCGDSGAVESVVGYTGDSEVDLPKAIEDTLAEAAEELLPCGWEINDGSFGELVVDIASQKLRREHSWRVSETEYEEIEFDLEAPNAPAQHVDDAAGVGAEDGSGERDECATNDEKMVGKHDDHSSDAATIRVVVACTNAEGEPDLAFVKIRCTPQQQDADEHCLAAQDWAATNNYEGPFVVFDERNVASKQLLAFFLWDSASVVDMA